MKKNTTMTAGENKNSKTALKKLNAQFRKLDKLSELTAKASTTKSYEAANVEYRKAGKAFNDSGRRASSLCEAGRKRLT